MSSKEHSKGHFNEQTTDYICITFSAVLSYLYFPHHIQLCTPQPPKISLDQPLWGLVYTSPLHADWSIRNTVSTLPVSLDAFARRRLSQHFEKTHRLASGLLVEACVSLHRPRLVAVMRRTLSGETPMTNLGEYLVNQEKKKREKLCSKHLQSLLVSNNRITSCSWHFWHVRQLGASLLGRLLFSSYMLPARHCAVKNAKPCKLSQAFGSMSRTPALLGSHFSQAFFW